MNIFEDYLAFKKENSELISNLVKTNSLIINHFSSIFIVIDYLYEKQLKRKLNQDEEYIFMTGYDYVFECFNLISIVLKDYFNNDFNELNKFPKNMDLLIYLNEYKNEILAREEFKRYLPELEKIENKIMECFKNKVEIEDEYFGLLDDIIYKTFTLNDIDSPSIESIFYEIALEYNLIKEDENASFTNIFNAFIEKNKKR